MEKKEPTSKHPPVFAFHFASLRIRLFSITLDAFIASFLVIAILRGYSGQWAQENLNVVYFMPGYYLVCTLLFSTTIGGLLLGLKIINTNGKRMSPPQAVLRFLLIPLTMLPLGVGFLLALTNPFRQTWHDKMAKTFVIHVDED